LTPDKYLDTVVADCIYTIVLVPAAEADINRLLIASGVGSVDNDKCTEGRNPKRRMITQG
jgi:hypothetical protein